jgi:hypothetical protein
MTGQVTQFSSCERRKPPYFSEVFAVFSAFAGTPADFSKKVGKISNQSGK